jgi:hypothetical protein
MPIYADGLVADGEAKGMMHVPVFHRPLPLPIADSMV